MTFIVDASLSAFIPIDADSDFPIQNLPFGIFKPKAMDAPRVGVALGEFVVDLTVLQEIGLLDIAGVDASVFTQPSLNRLLALGVETYRNIRKRLVELLRSDTALAASDKEMIENSLYRQSDVILCVPLQIGDYTDFYSSEQHAFNVGSMFRGKGNELMPNWKHMPIALHGRASSIVTTEAPIYRPHGQVLDQQTGKPIVSASKILDFELEMGFFIGKDSRRGRPIAIKDAEGYILGMVLVNDWSARDIQKWEYQPLGPFLAKSFATSISPWVVSLDALAPFKLAGVVQQPAPCDYLQHIEKANNYDINLTVSIQTEKMQAPQVICHSNHRYLYWSIVQQLAHQTIAGCNVKLGDLMASGTISGSKPDQFGSLLELTWMGEKPLSLNSGETRTFIEDGDQILLRGYCDGKTYRIGFGELRNQVLGNPNF